MPSAESDKVRLKSLFSSLTESSVWVRSIDGDESLTLSVIDKESNPILSMNPKQSGELKQTLARLAKKVGLNEDGKISLSSAPTVQENEVDGLNSVAWKLSKFLRIGACDENLMIPVRFNPPCVTEVSIGRRIIVGCKLVPKISLEFSEAEAAIVRWKKCPPGEPAAAVVIGHGLEYVPQMEDIGQSILCEVLPVDAAGRAGFGGITGVQGVFKRRVNGEPDAAAARKKGAPAADPAAVSVGGPAGPVVEAFPADWPFAARAQAAGAGAVRVCSYNTLCDQFCDTEWARANLYGGCPPECLSVHYRVRLLLRELEGYGAHVVCLQEVEAATFAAYIEPVLARAGYAAWYSPKTPKSNWGLCLAWRADRLAPAEQARLELFDPAQWARVPGAEDLVGRWPALREAMAECGTIAQLARFRVLPDSPEAPAGPARTLLVCNTHLFGNPDGPHVRMLQTAIILR
jgi:hypothetical protein